MRCAMCVRKFRKEEMRCAMCVRQFRKEGKRQVAKTRHERHAGKQVYYQHILLLCDVRCFNANDLVQFLRTEGSLTGTTLIRRFEFWSRSYPDTSSLVSKRTCHTGVGISVRIRRLVRDTPIAYSSWELPTSTDLFAFVAHTLTWKFRRPRSSLLAGFKCPAPVV